MSPASFTTSPALTGEQRKFVNPTQGFIGANVFGPDGKPTAIGVEPGGEVWLTEAEERMTAEAPRLPQHNPFVMEWEEPVEFTPDGEVSRTVTRTGTLVLADSAPRPLASSRYTAPRGTTEELRATREAMEGLSEPSPRMEPENESGNADGTPSPLRSDLSISDETSTLETTADDKSTDPSEPPVEVVGTDVEAQPPTTGTPSPEEIVATPEAEPDASVEARADAETPLRSSEPLGI
jgi:hypothetical protein